MKVSFRCERLEAARLERCGGQILKTLKIQAMNIIRDETNPIMILPLLVSWGIGHCNVKDCAEKPTTIISNVPDVPVFGMCEQHYQAGAEAGKFKYKLEF